MGTKGTTNRQRIVEAADRLFYVRGYNQTSFSDISDATGLPRGNYDVLISGGSYLSKLISVDLSTGTVTLPSPVLPRSDSSARLPDGVFRLADGAGDCSSQSSLSMVIENFAGAVRRLASSHSCAAT